MKIDPKLSEAPLWFIINTYSGHEKKVAAQIMQRAKAAGVEKDVLEVLVPTQEKILVSDGKKRKKEEKFLPGYVLVHLRLTEQTWYVVRNTDGVTGFVGTEQRPTPLKPSEVAKIMAFTKIEAPTFTTAYALGDAVKVTDGAFKDFVGSISSINEDKAQLEVLLSVFGRETPVVLDFLQVTKL